MIYHSVGPEESLDGVQAQTTKALTLFLEEAGEVATQDELREEL